MESPSFKLWYVWMENYEDDAQFDDFAKKIDLRPYVGEIKCPVIITAGEQDQLSPIEFSYEVFDLIKSPKKYVFMKGRTIRWLTLLL